MKIGAQLFTVRDFAKNPEELAQTLSKIADIGYEYVQVSGTCDYEPLWLKEQLDKNGLKCTLTHYNPQKIKETPKAVVEAHNVFGCENIGIGWYDMNKFGCQAFIDEFLPAAKAIKEFGGKLTYHNHDFEFAKDTNGKLRFENVIEAFAPGELNFTLDTYWVQKGGADPIWWIKNLNGRIPCVHFKDMAYEHKMSVVGEGNMNFDGIIAACIDCNVDYAFVEQDNCNGEDPFDCLARSFAFLKSRGLC